MTPRAFGVPTATLRQRRAEMHETAIAHNLTWCDSARLLFAKYLVAQGVVSDDDAVLIRPVRTLES